MRPYYALLVFVLFTACTKTKTGTCTLNCNRPGATAFFSGYTIGELDSVYVKTFNRDGSFSTLLYLNPDSVSFPGSTLRGLRHIYLPVYHDYELSIPATGQVFRVAMKDTASVKTFDCNNIPKGGCWLPFAGANVAGGNSDIFGTGPSTIYIMLKK